MADRDEIVERLARLETRMDAGASERAEIKVVVSQVNAGMTELRVDSLKAHGDNMVRLERIAVAVESVAARLGAIEPVVGNHQHIVSKGIGVLAGLTLAGAVAGAVFWDGFSAWLMRFFR